MSNLKLVISFFGDLENRLNMHNSESLVWFLYVNIHVLFVFFWLKTLKNNLIENCVTVIAYSSNPFSCSNI